MCDCVSHRMCARAGAAEAMEFGLVSHVANDHSALMTHARQIGRLIAQKSPVATHGVKTVLNYTRDHSVRRPLVP